MESDPLYPQISNILKACPLQAGPLFTSLKDLSLSVEWHDLRVFELEGTGWAVIIGHKRREDPLRVVLPLPLHTTSLKPSSLKSIFTSLSQITPASLPEPLPKLVPDLDKLRDKLNNYPTDEEEHKVNDFSMEESNTEIDKEMLYMAIVATDSTVVYYKLSKGIKKPADIPDE